MAEKYPICLQTLSPGRPPRNIECSYDTMEQCPGDGIGVVSHVPGESLLCEAHAIRATPAIGSLAAATRAMIRKKCVVVFRKDHAQTKKIE